LVEPAFERGVVEMLVLLAEDVLLGFPPAEVVLTAVAVVALAADDVVVVAELEADEDEWLEPPQAPSNTIGRRRTSRTPRLTVFRIDVDYLCADAVPLVATCPACALRC
jgi:hypothetical protein